MTPEVQTLSPLLTLGLVVGAVALIGGLILLVSRLGRFELRVAFRYMRTGRKGFLRTLTWISVGGIALGVASLLLVLSVMQGMAEHVRTKILSNNAHVMVVDTMRKPIAHWQPWVEEIRNTEGVAAVSPAIFMEGMLVNKYNTVGAVFRGINIENEAEITDLSHMVEKGEFTFQSRDYGDGPLVPENIGVPIPDSVDGVIVGKELAYQLSAAVGDEVVLVMPTGEWDPLTPIPPKMRKLQITGIVSTGMYEYDAQMAYIDLGLAQEFMSIGDKVTVIEVRVEDPFNAPEVTARLNLKLPNFTARDWTTMNERLFAALELEKLAMYLMVILVVLVAAFNVISNLVMLAVEKTRDIGVMKSFGVNRKQVRGVFLTVGLVLGGIGTLIGGAVGGILAWLLERYELIKLPADIYNMNHLPAVVTWSDIVIVVVSSMIITLLATLYPAIKAGKLDPLEAIRYE